MDGRLRVHTTRFVCICCGLWGQRLQGSHGTQQSNLFLKLLYFAVLTLHTNTKCIEYAILQQHYIQKKMVLQCSAAATAAEVLLSILLQVSIYCLLSIYRTLQCYSVQQYQYIVIDQSYIKIAAATTAVQCQQQPSAFCSSQTKVASSAWILNYMAKLNYSSAALYGKRARPFFQVTTYILPVKKLGQFSWGEKSWRGGRGNIHIFPDRWVVYIRIE